MNLEKNWEEFCCENLYDYIMLYNHSDTLLLSEIFLVYRNLIFTNFELDVNHFFLGIPSLSYNIMLKISKVKIELISNPEMSNFLGILLEEECHSYQKDIPNLVIVKCFKKN